MTGVLKFAIETTVSCRLKYFEDKIIEANDRLSSSTADLDTLKEVQLPKYDGVLGTIENSASYLKEKSMNFKRAIEITIDNKGIIIENLLKLTFLYFGIFMIQVLILPVLIFWLLMKIVNALFITTTMATMSLRPAQGEAAGA